MTYDCDDCRGEGEVLWAMIKKMSDKSVLYQAEDLGFWTAEDDYGRVVVPDLFELRRQIFEAMAEL